MIEYGINEARKTIKENVGGPFGAVITDENDKIISIASNTVLASKDPTAHAEINAIRLACQKLNKHDLEGCKLYTTCYPCPMCMSAIIWSNIKKVYYSADYKDAEKIGFRDDYIFNFIKNGCKDKDILELQEIEKDKILNVYNEYDKIDKQLY